MKRFSIVGVLIAASILTACSSTETTTLSDRIKVVAAESSWGSIAEQLGGDRAEVKSLIANPDVDPHDYEPTTADGSAVARAQVVIVNGVGYDEWAQRLVDANPGSHRIVVNVGRVTNRKVGDNPHRWYSPSDVKIVVDAIADALKQVDASSSAFYDNRRDVYINQSLRRYDEVRAETEQRYMGTVVGTTESVFTPMADDLGLRLATPASFVNAVSEGEEPTPADKATVDDQLESHEIEVLIYNTQNASPDVQRLVSKAQSLSIPVVTVTETPPPGVAFQDWQTRQVESLLDALEDATKN